MTGEADVIGGGSGPVTVGGLVADLRSLGVGDGDIVIVHSSLRALGWVAGGPQAVVEALLASVGPNGTVVMPTQSGHLSDPAGWSNPPLPAAWIDNARDGLPAYDPHLTTTRGMGQIVECFRAHPGTIRSDHPTLSFAARGPAAEVIVGSHPLTPALGETSPLARLYELDAKVLLLGVDHGSDTSMHLAEYRATWPGSGAMTSEGAPVLVAGVRSWVTYEDIELDADDFGHIGRDFARTGLERTGNVGDGVGRLANQRSIVDFAVAWMSANRPRSAVDGTD